MSQKSVCRCVGVCLCVCVFVCVCVCVCVCVVCGVLCFYVSIFLCARAAGTVASTNPRTSARRADLRERRRPVPAPLSDTETELNATCIVPAKGPLPTTQAPNPAAARPAGTIPPLAPEMAERKRNACTLTSSIPDALLFMPSTKAR